MYHDWFLRAGRLGLPEQDEDLAKPAGIQVLIERIEQHVGAQTNIAGDAKAPIASGEFNSATTFGDGDAEDNRRNTSSQKDNEGG